jgi:hypothetical protein
VKTTILASIYGSFLIVVSQGFEQNYNGIPLPGNGQEISMKMPGCITKFTRNGRKFWNPWFLLLMPGSRCVEVDSLRA